jgi:predicted transcriptional regulator
MKVLLSIKPKYADLIFDGTKKFEFRRTIFKNENIKTVIVYASSPVRKVIGEFEIETILNNDLAILWKQTKDYAGIDKAYFFEYFINKEKGYAIKIKKAKKYRNPLCLKEDFNLLPPQSFLYLDGNEN